MNKIMVKESINYFDRVYLTKTLSKNSIMGNYGEYVSAGLFHFVMKIHYSSRRQLSQSTVLCNTLEMLFSYLCGSQQIAP